jgi:hypothetical protein
VKEAVKNTGPLSTPRAVSVRDTLGVAASLRLHWPEYLMEAGEMSLYMFCTCSFATLLQHPASPVRHFVISGIVRRALVGLAIGATVMALIMSPWGKQSGGHINPAMTFAFYRLGKTRPWDAANGAWFRKSLVSKDLLRNPTPAMIRRFYSRTGIILAIGSFIRYLFPYGNIKLTSVHKVGIIFPYGNMRSDLEIYPY